MGNLISFIYLQKLKFCSSKNRNLWRHHYYASQGVILVFSHFEVEFANKLIIVKLNIYKFIFFFYNWQEALNIFNDFNLKNVPILVLFDKNLENIEHSIEEFRKKLVSMPNILFNTQFIDFNENGISMVNCGIDWLVEVMKPII